MRIKKIKPIHPGEILKEEFLLPLSVSQYRLAKDIAVSAIRISEIVRQNRAVSVNTAMRLAKYFNTSVDFWLNLQMKYDLEKESDKMAAKIDKEVKVFQFLHVK